jgi:hypothetical protein
MLHRVNIFIDTLSLEPELLRGSPSLEGTAG